jgi:hypothetical protein
MALTEHLLFHNLLPNISDSDRSYVSNLLGEGSFDSGLAAQGVHALSAKLHACRAGRLAAICDKHSAGAANAIAINLSKQLPWVPPPLVNSDTNTAKYPVLAQYGIPFANARAINGIQRDLYRLNKETTKSNTIKVDLGNNAKTSLVHIPQCGSSSQSIKSNRKFIKEIVKALDENDQDTICTRTTLLESFVSDKRFRSPFQSVFTRIAKFEGLATVFELDEATTFAIQSDCNLTHTQMRILRRDLLAVLGFNLLCGETKMKRKLSAKVPTVITGKAKEKLKNGASAQVRWHCKKANEMVLIFLETLKNADSLAGDYSHLDLSVAIDHGKGFLRATLVIVLRLGGGNTRAELAGTFALASCRCKGDSYELLQDTFAPTINEALHRIKESGNKVSIFSGIAAANMSNDKLSSAATAAEFSNSLSIERSSSSSSDDGPSNIVQAAPADAGDSTESGKLTYCYEFGTVPTTQSHSTKVNDMTVELWMAGDLKFFMMATSRESSDRHWCFYCDLMSKRWKLDALLEGNEWTNATLQQFQESIREQYSGLEAEQK